MKKLIQKVIKFKEIPVYIANTNNKKIFLVHKQETKHNGKDPFYNNNTKSILRNKFQEKHTNLYEKILKILERHQIRFG